MNFSIGLSAVGAALLLVGCATEADNPLVVPQKLGEKATIEGHRHYGAPIDIPVVSNRAKSVKVTPTPKDESRSPPDNSATPQPQ